MKKSTRNLLIIFIVALVIVCLFSFNVNGVRSLFGMKDMPFFSSMNASFDTMEEMAYDYETAMPMMSYKSKNLAIQANGISGAIDDAIVRTEEGERKLVKNINLSCETKDFTKVYDGIDSLVSKYDGIIDNHSLNNGSVGAKNQRRSCYYTIRIPSEKTDDFIKEITKDLNVTYKYESVNDVTDNFNETISRLETLKVEQEKLNELISKATKVEDIVNIEERLSDVNHQIQTIENRISNMNKTVDYSTINMDISEVLVLTEPKDSVPTKDNIMAAFNKNFEDCKIFLKNVGIYIFTHLPAIVLGAVIFIILVIILIIICSISDRTGNTEKKEKKEKVIKEDRHKKIKREEVKEIKEEKTEEDKIEDLDENIPNEDVEKVDEPISSNEEPKPVEEERRETEIKDNSGDDSTTGGYTMTDLDFTI